ARCAGTRTAALGRGSSRGTRAVASRFCVSVVTEVGHIPTGTLKLKSRSGQLFLESGLAAGRTFRQCRIRDLLQHVFGKAAGFTTIGINRHKKISAKTSKTLNYKGILARFPEIDAIASTPGS